MNRHFNAIKSAHIEIEFTYWDLSLLFTFQYLIKSIFSFLLVSLFTLSYSQPFGLWNKGLSTVNTDIIFVLNINIIDQHNGAIDNAGPFVFKENWTNDNPSGNLPNGYSLNGMDMTIC